MENKTLLAVIMAALLILTIIAKCCSCLSLVRAKMKFIRQAFFKTKGFNILLSNNIMKAL